MEELSRERHHAKTFMRDPCILFNKRTIQVNPEYNMRRRTYLSSIKKCDFQTDAQVFNRRKLHSRQFAPRVVVQLSDQKFFELLKFPTTKLLLAEYWKKSWKYCIFYCCLRSQKRRWYDIMLLKVQGCFLLWSNSTKGPSCISKTKAEGWTD